MSDQITVDRNDLDNAIFSAAQEAADKVAGLSVRERMKFALATADSIMASVEAITEAGKRSESAKKAAAARYSKPKPGPAIPPPGAEATQAAPPVPAHLQGILPNVPPPHPSLAPQAPAQTAMPFGAAPA